LVGAVAVLEHGGPTRLLKTDRQVRRVMRRFDEVSFNEELDLKQPYCQTSASDPIPLDGYMKEVRSRLSEFPSRTVSAKARSVLRAYVTACSTNLCEGCSSKTNPPSVPCQWTKASQDEDQRAVESRGACIEPVREVFRFCDKLAKAAYANALGHEPPQTVTLSTGPSEVNDSPLEIAMRAEVDDSVSTLLREAHLAFYVPEFKLSDYLALLPVLFHECFVHGYCGVNVKGKGVDVSKPFHDGWMDCISTWVLTDTLRGATALAPKRIVTYRGEFLARVESFRDRRYREELLDKHDDASDWAAGAEALSALQWLCRRALEDTGQVPLEPTLRLLLVNLSVAINASGVSHGERASLVEVLSTKYGFGTDEERGQALADGPEILDCIAEYLARRDPVAFVRQVAAIR